jgi:predicted AlkP superfamily phosphohydrolase/phosphomutase
VADLAGTAGLDLLMVNLEATDGAHHFLWQHHDRGHPRHDPQTSPRWADGIGRVYEATDRELQRLMDAFRPDSVFVVSDHGGGPSSDWVLFMNDWLVDEGFLVLASGARRARLTRSLYAQARKRLSVPARRMLRPLLGSAVSRAVGAALYGDVDWSRSRAYAHMQPAVRLNLRDRDPLGIVRSEDRAAVLEELTERARALRLPTGEPAFTSIQPAEELYRGDASGGPDLVMETAPGLGLRSRNTTGRAGSIKRLGDLGFYMPSGMHRRSGMVAAAGAGLARSGREGPWDIHQVAPSVLAVMGVPAPQADAPPFSFVTERVLEGPSGGPERVERSVDLSPEEEDEVLERLRGLGYVD